MIKLLRLMALWAGPLFYSITMYLLHPDEALVVFIGAVITCAALAYLNKVIP